MHPTLARFLSFEAAQATLARESRRETLDAEERLFVQAARREPERRAELIGGSVKASSTQQSLLYLATHAALLALRQDPRWAELVEATRRAIVDAGSSPDEADGVLASVVADEAFGWEDEADRFDAPFFEETLAGLPELLSVDREKLRALRAEFLLGAAGQKRQAREQALRRLLENAWEDGPEPINAESLAAAREALSTAAELVELRALLELLAQRGWLGAIRRRRLEALLSR